MEPKPKRIISRRGLFAVFAGTAVALVACSEQENYLRVHLGQPFSLKENQSAKVLDTGLEIKITRFYNNPCPKDAQCIWSGIGIEFEYELHGQIQRGINLVQAFDHQVNVIETDYESYANLVIEKMKSA